jgi:hypothetical protein
METFFGCYQQVMEGEVLLAFCNAYDSPITKNYVASDVNSVKVENLYCRQ